LPCEAKEVFTIEEHPISSHLIKERQKIFESLKLGLVVNNERKQLPIIQEQAAEDLPGQLSGDLMH
jgi:hypothetical protein